jgi:hypothetical protein
MGIIRANDEIKTLSGCKQPKTFWEKMIDWLAIMCVVECCIAECFCDYGMFVENYFYPAIEMSLWGLALV